MTNGTVHDERCDHDADDEYTSPSALARGPLREPLRVATALLRPGGELTFQPSRHARTMTISGALLLAALLFGVWGVALNTTSVSAALANFVKVPMLVFASGFAAVPLVVLLWKLFGPKGARGTALVMAYALALLGGGAVLAMVTPLVAIYQHSSTWFGMHVAVATAIAGCLATVWLLVRVLRKLTYGSSRSAFGPAFGLVFVQLAALSQLASVTSPVFNVRTPFGRGIDGAHQTEEPSHVQPVDPGE